MSARSFSRRTTGTLLLLGAVGCGLIGAVIARSPEQQRGLAQADSGLQSLFRQVQPGIVRVEAGTNSGTDGLYESKNREGVSGTGFFVSPTEVLTAGHIVYSPAPRTQRQRSPLYVRSPNGESFPAKQVGVDVHDDLALLSVAGDPHVHPLTLARRRPAVGSPALTIGAPGFELAALTVGVVSRAEEARLGDADGYVLTTALNVNAASGNSGGPVLNTDGEVLGLILSYEGERGDPLQIMRPADVLRSDLATLRRHTVLSNPLDGALLFDVHPEIRRSYELAAPHGIFVASLETDAPLFEVGLREEDEILALDGHPVGEVTTALQLLLHRAPGPISVEYASHALGGLRETVRVIVRATPAPR